MLPEYDGYDMTTVGQETIEAVTAAALDRAPVNGATHRFYRYPARFSPQFARAVIEGFTSPGDLVLDPFVGGGTTAVEALRAGRRCIGSDINELALFVSKVKTTVLSADEVDFLRLWFREFEKALRISASVDGHEYWRDKGYFRHMENQETWRHRNLIQSALHKIESLHSERLSDFMRCVLLRSMQLSLDGRRSVMTIGHVRSKISEHFNEMIDDMSALVEELSREQASMCPTIVKCNASELHNTPAITDLGAPALVLTSPPYPGLHVLYHRWQVNGRRETAAPYWIADKLDGDGARYYTLGNRHEKELTTYFRNLRNVFSSVADIIDEETIIVQMVAFSDPEWQLPKYLEVLEEAGLAEMYLNADGAPRIWRDVPNRKWHAERQERRDGSRELVLFHRKA
jgi:hypothetical protein